MSEVGNSSSIEESAHGLPPGTTGENIAILKVKVIKGIHLAKKDIFGLSDPYCFIKLIQGEDRNDVITTLQTKVKKRTLNPQWDCSFHLRVNTEQHRLVFEIYDENRITRDDFLGESEVTLNYLPSEAENDSVKIKEYPLVGRSSRSRVRGEIKVYISVVSESNHADITTQDSVDGTFQGRHLARDMDAALGENPSRIENDWEMAPQDVVAENYPDRQHSQEPQNETPLPEGWEKRQDANGRTFFVDHANRLTTWHRPTITATAASRSSASDERFNIRRHISTDDSQQPHATPAASTNPEEEVENEDDEEEQLPAGWELRRNVNGRTLYINHNNRTTTWNLPEMPPPPEESTEEDPPSEAAAGTTTPAPNVRLHPDVPSQEEHQLPPGWAMQLAPNTRVFFINHNERITSWHDPRFMGQTEASAEDLGPLPAGWEERMHADGRVFFIDHETQSTQWEDPRLQVRDKKRAETLPYSRDYKRKYDFFKSRLKKPEHVPNKYEIHVRRQHLLEDSYRFVLHSCKNVDLLKTKLWIVFDGETGLDYGGVSREWFYLLSKEIFNPYYGLFEYSATDNYTLQINPNSGIANDQHLSYFKFIGRVAGMAVYHGKLLDAFFIRPFYKMMLARKISLQDMESVDSEYHHSLKWLLENDPEILELMFQVEEESFGTIISRELKPNGANIPVTNANKQEYIDLVIRWRFMDRISEQMAAFIKGFQDIIPQSALQLFDDRELEYLMCGLGEIDVDDWRKNTQYRSGYHDKHVVIQWFWKAVYTFDNELKARLLQFVTGTSRVPMNGFAELYGSNGPQKFAIERWGVAHQLPRSHTCFNRIDLPPYNSYHELREKLRMAIENTEGFEGVD